MSLNINFIGSTAVLKHVNLRKQGNEDSRVLAIDLSIIGETQAKILNDLLGVSEGDDISGVFWSTLPGTDPESLRTHALEEIGIDGVWPNRIVTLGKHQIVADVKKIKFRPRPGHRLDIGAQVSVEAPGDEIMDYVIANIQEHVNCRIESQPELDLKQSKTHKQIDDEIVKVARAASGIADPLYKQACAFVVMSGKTTITALQRQLKVGYNRAALILEALELAGVVGPLKADGKHELKKQ